MDVTDVEGVIERIEIFTETSCCKEVISNGRVIVVVSRRAEDSKVKVTMFVIY